jgi:hypothetical protein
MLNQLQSGDFTPHLNDKFFIHAESLEPIEAELIEVSELGAPAFDQRPPFSIVLRTRQKDQYLIQAIYDVQHAEMGTLDLFLVPLGPDEEGMRYEAVFT